jgi:hypothetical protein
LKGDRSVPVAGRHAGGGGALVGGGALRVDGHGAELHCWRGLEVCEECLVVMLDAGVDVLVRWNVFYGVTNLARGISWLS